MRRMHVREFLNRIEEINDRYRFEESELRRKHKYEMDMLEINYHGRDWLTTGLVGGWDEE